MGRADGLSGIPGLLTEDSDSTAATRDFILLLIIMIMDASIEIDCDDLKTPTVRKVLSYDSMMYVYSLQEAGWLRKRERGQWTRLKLGCAGEVHNFSQLKNAAVHKYGGKNGKAWIGRQAPNRACSICSTQPQPNVCFLFRKYTLFLEPERLHAEIASNNLGHSQTV